MKRFLLAFFCFASLVVAEEESLLPAPINAFLPKIKAGMTPEEITTVVVKSYVSAESRVGIWSGGSGSLGCRLDDRFTFTIDAHTNSEGKQVVSENARIYIIDWLHKRRLTIVPYQWQNGDEAAPSIK